MGPSAGNGEKRRVVVHETALVVTQIANVCRLGQTDFELYGVSQHRHVIDCLCFED